MRKIKGCDLRKMRNFSNLTTEQAAKAAGVKTRKTYENWEKDTGSPNINQFLSLVSAFGFNGYTMLEFLSFHEHVKQTKR